MLRVLKSVFVVTVLALALAGCSSKPSKQHASTTKISSNKQPSVIMRNEHGLNPFSGKGSPYLKTTGKVPKGGGRYHIGKPYNVAGNWFKPREQPNYDQTGMASWYGEAFHRRKTANGEYFDMNDLTAAHATLPIPSYAKVTNTANGKSIIVRINDRGPFVGTRIIDLSKRSADVLDFRHKGKAKVRVQWLGNAPLNDQGSHLAMMNKHNQNGASKSQLAAATGQASRNIAVAEAEPKSKPAQVQQVAANEADSIGQAGYLIHAATYANKQNAEAAYAYLAELDTAQIQVLAGKSGQLYRVQLGPIQSRQKAQDLMQSIREQGFPDATLGQASVQQVASRQ
jgi:rare lipoprotein A